MNITIPKGERDESDSHTFDRILDQVTSYGRPRENIMNIIKYKNFDNYEQTNDFIAQWIGDHFYDWCNDEKIRQTFLESKDVRTFWRKLWTEEQYKWMPLVVAEIEQEILIPPVNKFSF